DMAEEQDALFRLAEANGDARASGRLEAGHALIGERFGLEPVPLIPGAPGDAVVRRDGHVVHVIVDGHLVVKDGALTKDDLATIEAEAHLQAGHLWNRMADL
ncbi:MAG: hypothetical protein MI741_10115, partial [Rhodospirillales bacterium]|nr:hypothetical protein [Rhodospirillales bacterium]